jgi:Domain of unknown function (DUF4388)
MTKYSIDNHGRLQLPAVVARKLAGRPLQPVSVGDRHLLLGVHDGKGELALAGALGDISVADLLSFLNMFRKTGVLRFHLVGGSKELYFHNGEVVFATSTFPEEELGEVLCDHGQLDREVLQKIRQSPAAAKGALGRLLVEKGAVSAKDLWLATRQQVEGIVFHLFHAHAGSFAFVPRPLTEDEVLRLSMGTQNLIMEGLQRVDERDLFLRRIGSLDLRVVPENPAPAELGPAERRLFETVAAQPYDVRGLVRSSGLGEFATLRLVYQLLEKRAIRLEDAPATEVTGALGEMLAICNAALVALYRRLAPVTSGLHEELRLFLRDLPQPFSFVLRDVGLRQDGSVDGGRILANLAGLDEGDQLRLLADALNELIFHGCMAARRDLREADAAELVRRVQEVGGRIKNLVGRME